MCPWRSSSSAAGARLRPRLGGCTRAGRAGWRCSSARPGGDATSSGSPDFSLAGFFSADPVLHVIRRQVADGGFVYAAGRVDVAQQGQMLVYVSPVVVPCAVVDAGAAVDVPVGPVEEGHIPGRCGLLNEAFALDPARRKSLPCFVDQVAEGGRVVFVGEGLGAPAAAASALHPPNLVVGRSVLAFTPSDGCHGGRICPFWAPCLACVWPAFLPVRKRAGQRARIGGGGRESNQFLSPSVTWGNAENRDISSLVVDFG